LITGGKYRRERASSEVIIVESDIISRIAEKKSTILQITEWIGVRIWAIITIIRKTRSHT